MPVHFLANSQNSINLCKVSKWVGRFGKILMYCSDSLVHHVIKKKLFKHCFKYMVKPTYQLTVVLDRFLFPCTNQLALVQCKSAHLISFVIVMISIFNVKRKITGCLLQRALNVHYSTRHK